MAPVLAPNPPADDAPHLLVVDDDRRIRALLSRFLSTEGYRISTADSAAMARAKLASLSFDLLIGATPDTMGQLVEGQLIQPLSHSYIPNIAQAWPDYTDPFYDKKWQYTVPYTIYTTGISWRKDLVHENPFGTDIDRALRSIARRIRKRAD